MQAYVLKRFLWGVVAGFGVISLVFVLTRLLPGDVALFMLLGEGGAPDPIRLEALRETLGLDQPLYQQYLSWLWGLVHLDLGTSLWTGMPVLKEIWIRLPYTLTLAVLAILISIVVAVPLGVVAALKQDSWADYILRMFLLAGLSMPSFWCGILLTLFLIITFRWFPPLTYAPVYDKPFIALQQLIFPAIVLGYRQSSVAARMMRSSMLEVLREDYVRSARAKGLTEKVVVYLHALKNAILPVITIFGLEAITLLGGVVVVEQVFRVPGIGTLLLDAIMRRDIPLIQGVTLIIVVFVLVVNLTVDLVYVWVDPRIRYR